MKNQTKGLYWCPGGCGKSIITDTRYSFDRFGRRFRAYICLRCGTHYRKKKIMDFKNGENVRQST